MSGFKFLIDTNVIIGLEDPQLVDSSFAELVRTSSANHIRLFIDKASYDDVERDTNASRKAITLSKLAKFERLGEIPQPEPEKMAARYGALQSENDHSDARLLVALESKAVDFLITQDNGIHKRAEKAGLAGSVFTVEEAVEWLRQTYQPKTVSLPYVIERKAYEVDRSHPLFASIEADYPPFKTWFDKCIKEHRDCWVLQLAGKTAGIVIRKDETHDAAQTVNRGPKILKVCTLKVHDEHLGEKFGEQLLKQILWYAQQNAYDLVYLTTFPKQRFLIKMLEYYGFQHTSTRENGELVLEKMIQKGSLMRPAGDALICQRAFYPRFLDGDDIQKFCIPIKPDYHVKLFPEIAFIPETPLFPGLALMTGRNEDRIPGNTIRKVYLCRAKTNQPKPGDLLFFYMSKDEKYVASQTITTIGIVEQIQEAKSTEELMHLTAKRSVFSAKELEEKIRESNTLIKVIDFLLVGHLTTFVPLSTLLNSGVFLNHPPQSIAELSPEKYARLKTHLNLGFDI